MVTGNCKGLGSQEKHEAKLEFPEGCGEGRGVKNNPTILGVGEEYFLEFLGCCITVKISSSLGNIFLNIFVFYDVEQSQSICHYTKVTLSGCGFDD